MNKIVLLNCYLGKLPWYFDFFLKSCESNSSVDFILFSNDEEKRTLPENVKMIKFSLETFNSLASQKLNLKVEITNAYKICDFKPAFGVIFQEEISNYDFWGVCDIDLVFGRIREFMTEDLLHNYDVISVKDSFPSGYFLLFRNNEIINNLFQKSKDHKLIFTSNDNFCFDECGGAYDEVISGVNILDVPTKTESIHHVLVKEQNNIRVHFDLFIIEGTPGKIKWENGILSYKNEYEVLLYHFSSYKNNVFSDMKKWRKIPECFYIDKYNIRKYSNYGISAKWTDNIKPNLKNFLFRIDMSCSKFLNIKPMLSIEKGKYSYMNRNIFIGKNDKEQNYVCYEDSENQFDLIKMIFHAKYFFNTHTRQYYKDEKNSFSEVLLDGNLIKYSKS
ncbi:DUF6625 family protein [Flavobacterium sp. ov086]|uniref:DUF6625 family protein n=1 Tax=Flavobacterium sp. ov086 TaxID=1761785 RepID=UPI000B642165|nr:DUF6625 family protein [Flavobacterium sp. ov086]SNR22802.1 hypothetical protein SAMN04487979_10152 [Flavobacterium sp. ov086]